MLFNCVLLNTPAPVGCGRKVTAPGESARAVKQHPVPAGAQESNRHLPFSDSARPPTPHVRNDFVCKTDTPKYMNALIKFKPRSMLT